MNGASHISAFAQPSNSQSPSTTNPSASFAPDPLHDSPTGVASSGQSSDSPILDNAASMDWANWDDLVREYGMEGIGQGQPGLLNPTNTSHLGMVNWF